MKLQKRLALEKRFAEIKLEDETVYMGFLGREVLVVKRNWFYKIIFTWAALALISHVTGYVIMTPPNWVATVFNVTVLIPMLILVSIPFIIVIGGLIALDMSRR